MDSISDMIRSGRYSEVITLITAAMNDPQTVKDMTVEIFKGTNAKDWSERERLYFAVRQATVSQTGYILGMVKDAYSKE